MSDENAITRYEGDDACVPCEGLGWRFPRRDQPEDEPKIDGVISYRAMPCLSCDGRGHQQYFMRLGWGGVR